MDESVYYPSFRLLLRNISKPEDIYDEGTPTEEGFILYSIITPVICVFGIFGNTLSLIVLSRRELKGSVFVYLAVLAFSDLCSSILLFVSGLSCGAFYVDSNWPLYDIFIGLPLSTIFNTLAVCTTVMVTFDRICYLSNPLRRRKPKFCHVYVARRVVVVSVILSIITSSPFFFVFTYNDERIVQPRPFFYSRIYDGFNWIRFLTFGVIPSIILIIGNGFLVHGLRKLKKMYSKCNNSIKNKRPHNYANLTTTLILIVFIFVSSQIPAMLVNREAAPTFFYIFSNQNDSYNSKTLENAREISTVLNAVSLSSDFVLYYLFCPAFYKVLTKLFRKKKKCETLQMNVFILGNKMCLDNETNVMTGKLFQMIDPGSCRDSLPSSIYDESCDKIDEEDAKINRDTLITLCSDDYV